MKKYIVILATKSPSPNLSELTPASDFSEFRMAEISDIDKLLHPEYPTSVEYILDNFAEKDIYTDFVTIWDKAREWAISLDMDPSENVLLISYWQDSEFNSL